ncbi:uncharacterized protein LOC143023986 [Oratosquilla oratoria]|uniref:uncharacterized protein LOC143023986 n=1 Tax=Oratosquilla oratoria TaxID=337810 RepID=UPI003F75C958
MAVLSDKGRVTRCGNDDSGWSFSSAAVRTSNINSSLLPNFTKSRRLRIGGSWFQRRDPYRWAWYSNARGLAKEIDHTLVSAYWKIIQNFSVYRSAESFGTDHRVVVATLIIRIKSRRISRCNPLGFQLKKLRDGACALEYAISICNRFDALGSLEDPEELWDTFRRETLKADEECVGERPRSSSGVASHSSWIVQIVDQKSKDCNNPFSPTYFSRISFKLIMADGFVLGV